MVSFWGGGRVGKLSVCGSSSSQIKSAQLRLKFLVTTSKCVSIISELPFKVLCLPMIFSWIQF